MNKAEQDQQLQHSLEKFEQIMEHRSEMYLRLSHRVRTVVRGGMAVFAMVGLAMFILLYTLVVQIQHARASTAQLNQLVAVMALDMGAIVGTVEHMEAQLRLMERVGQNLSSITLETGSIAGQMSDVGSEIKSIQDDMSMLNRRLAHVAGNMGSMGQAVNHMGHSVKQMSRPASIFNMFPMP